MGNRIRKSSIVTGVLIAVTAASASAETNSAKLGEIVVSATRTEIPAEEVGSSVTVITAMDIERKQQKTVADALRMVPGLDLVRTGNHGGSTSVFMRGAKSEHTLVIIDGVEINDPSSAGGGFNFANLTTDNIERIEILRGPQSTLYGSRAIGGVINIITKRGDGRLKGFISAEGGSLATARESAGASGGNDLLQYSLAVSRLDTNGISSASGSTGNTESDSYQNTAVATRLGITPTKNSEIDLSLRYNRSRTAVDNGGGTGSDDPNHFMKSDELFFRTQGWASLFDGLWEQKLGVSFADLSWHDDNDPDDKNRKDLLRSYFHGQSVKLDWQNTIRLHKTNTVTLGVETTEENAKSDYYSESAWGPYTSDWKEKFARTTGVYLQDQINLLDSWFSTAGVRVDDHSRFGTEVTYRFTTACQIKQSNTRLKGSYGTGFKAPSLYQLYSSYGSPLLKPDKSIGWDLGVEQALPFMQAKIGVTWFRNEYSQMIDFDMKSWKYVNIAKASSQGLELAASIQPVDSLAFKSVYTFTETRDGITGKQLARRPKHKLGFDMNYGFLGKGNINIGMVWVGTRYDDTANNVKMKDYLLVNLAGSFDLTKNLQLFGRIENLFDRKYEEVAGYGNPGIGLYGGIKVSF